MVSIGIALASLVYTSGCATLRSGERIDPEGQKIYENVEEERQMWETIHGKDYNPKIEDPTGKPRGYRLP